MQLADITADVGVSVARILSEVKGASNGGGVTTIGFGSATGSSSSSSTSTGWDTGASAASIAPVAALSEGMVRRKPVPAAVPAAAAAASAGPAIPGGSPESTAAAAEASLAGSKRGREDLMAMMSAPADEQPSELKSVRVE
jgi:hypothetical protein